jgi:hypothetical protein
LACERAAAEAHVLRNRSPIFVRNIRATAPPFA